MERKLISYVKRHYFTVDSCYNRNPEDHLLVSVIVRVHSSRVRKEVPFVFVNFTIKFLVRLHGEYNILVKLCGNTT